MNKKKGGKEKKKDFWKWFFLIMITLLYPVLYLLLFKISMLQTFMRDLFFIFSTLLFPISCFIFSIFILISFKNKPVLTYGIIGTFVGIILGFLILTQFAFQNLRFLLLPFSLILNYLMKLIIGESEFVGILFIPLIFIFLFTLVGAIIGHRITKKRK